MAEYLIQEETMTLLADQARRLAGLSEPLNAAEIAEIFQQVEGNIAEVDGAYLIQAVDVAGNPIKTRMCNTGQIFALPEVPTLPELRPQTWTSSTPLSSLNYVIVEDKPMTVGAIYEPMQDAIVIPINVPANTTIKFNRLSGLTSIDWGDGTINSSTSHTYTHTDGSLLRWVYIYGVTQFSSLRLTDDSTTLSLITTVYFPPTCVRVGGLQDSALESVIIAKGTTGISSGAFAYCNLTNINIPNSVKSIASSAFRSCYSLKNIIIPYGVTSIGEQAFNACEGLADITIPDSVTNIGANAFNACKNLTNITIPDNVKSINDKTFRYCWNLSSVKIGSGVTSIGSQAFYDCKSLSSIIIPNSVKSIGADAFLFTSLTSAVYQGTAEEWANVSVSSGNTGLTNILTFAG